MLLRTRRLDSGRRQQNKLVGAVLRERVSSGKMKRSYPSGEEKVRRKYSFYQNYQKVLTFFTVTPSGDSRQQRELDAAVSSSSAVGVGRGGDVASEARVSFHEDVSIKSLEMVNYIKC